MHFFFSSALVRWSMQNLGLLQDQFLGVSIPSYFSPTSKTPFLQIIFKIVQLSGSWFPMDIFFWDILKYFLLCLFLCVYTNGFEAVFVFIKTRFWKSIRIISLWNRSDTSLIYTKCCNTYSYMVWKWAQVKVLCDLSNVKVDRNFANDVSYTIIQRHGLNRMWEKRLRLYHNLELNKLHHKQWKLPEDCECKPEIQVPKNPISEHRI
jgi:hypothetical protein